MKVKDFIFDTFLRLTSKTVPYGYEDKFVSDVMTLLFPEDIEKDKHGNYFYKIGNSRTIFASHIDTVSKEYISVVTEIEGNIVRSDGKTNLGADDKAGMTVMLWMIRNKIPGLYYFFIGEEVGCIGSGLVAKYEDIRGNYDRVISFDRRGTDSIITYQSSSRCCSDKFADSLARELNKSGMFYLKDKNGVYTDSAEFTDIVPECTNISVGYYNEHTKNEYQDLKHLEKLAIACTKVDWESLPVERDTNSHDYNNLYYPGKNYSTYDDFHVIETRKKKRSRRKKNRDSGRSKTYYDYGDGDLFELDEFLFKDNDKDFNLNNDKYTWIVNKLCDNNFTETELYKIKENYLDLDSDYDKWFFDYLKEQVVN